MGNLTEMVATAFAVGGPLETIMRERKGVYTPNPQQAEYAACVAHNIECGGGRVNLLEGATGTGKTQGYLIPLLLQSALTGKQVSVSTLTLALQRQILDSEFAIAADVVKRMTGKVLTAAPRKGRRNFVAPGRVRDLAQKLQGTDRGVLESLSDAEGGDIGAWLETNDLPNGVRIEDVCILPGDRGENAKHYVDHVDASRYADLVVLNHALTLLDCLTYHKLLGAPKDDMRQISHMVLDEADALPSVAESMRTSRVSIPMVRRLVENLDAAGADVKRLWGLVGEWSVKMDEWLADVRSWYNSPFRADGTGGYVLLTPTADLDRIRGPAFTLAWDLSVHLTEAADKIRGKGLSDSEWVEVTEIADDLRRFAGRDKNGQEHADSYTPVLSWSPVLTYPGFSAHPKDPARVLSRLWRSGETYAPFLDSCILTSATLGDPGNDGAGKYYRIADQIGLHKQWHNYDPTECRTFEPRNFGTMRFQFADRKVPDPMVSVTVGNEERFMHNPDWLKYVANAISGLGTSAGKGMLVLCASYDDVREISDQLRQMGVRGVVEHQRGDKLVGYTERFKTELAFGRPGILLTPAGWEGLDLPGMLSHVVIPKIPFPAPDSARNHAVYWHYVARGLDDSVAKGRVWNDMTASVRRRLKQGLGRGIRSATDDVTVTILDPRFPLPDRLAGNRKLGQANRSGSSGWKLASCIPVRFRREYERGGIVAETETVRSEKAAA